MRVCSGKAGTWDWDWDWDWDVTQPELRHQHTNEYNTSKRPSATGILTGQSILLWFACMSWSSEDEQAQARATFRAIIAFEKISFLLRSRPGLGTGTGTGMGLDPNLSAEGFQQRQFWKQKKNPRVAWKLNVLFFILQHRSVRIGKNWEILSYQEPRATKSLLLRFLFWLS